MKKLLALILALTLCLALFTGCNTKSTGDDSIIDESLADSESTDVSGDSTDTEVDTESLDYSNVERGEVADGVYSSDVLGVKFTVPENWTVYSNEQIAQIMQISADILDDENMKEAFKTLPVVYDFMAVDMSTGNNIIIILEPFAANPVLSLFDSSSYLDTVMSQMNNIDGTSVTLGERTNITLSDAEFLMQTVATNINETQSQQCYLLKKDDLFMQSIIITIMDGSSVETVLSHFE